MHADDFLLYLLLGWLAVLLFLGYSTDLDERLEREIEYHEEVWERSREGNRLMGCFKESYSELYAIDGELVTEKAEKSFLDCI